MATKRNQKGAAPPPAQHRKPGPKPTAVRVGRIVISELVALLGAARVRTEECHGGAVAVYSHPSGKPAAYVYATARVPWIGLRSMPSLSGSSVRDRVRYLKGKGHLLDVPGGDAKAYAAALAKHLNDVEREAAFRESL